MSDPRYVIVRRGQSSGFIADLPDAEHVHVTRHPDGTITATPMRQASFVGSTYELAADGGWQRVTSWVDCPTGGDQ